MTATITPLPPPPQRGSASPQNVSDSIELTTTSVVQIPEASSEAPLSPEHFEQLSQAKQRVKKIRRAAGVATFNGWTTAVFGLITVFFGLFNLNEFLLGLGMCIVALVEHKGARDLRQLDLKAPQLLAMNQIGFAVLLSAYAVWKILGIVTGPSPLAKYEQAGPQVVDMLAPMEDFMRVIMLAVYASLIVFAFTVQGGTALYYFRRRRHIVSYAKETPAWIVELQDSGVSLS